MKAVIIATPSKGVNIPLDQFSATIETSTDLPADAIGEVVTLAMQNVWNAGFDPVKDGIICILTFKTHESITVNDVLSLSERAVNMTSLYGHSDVGDVLISMLKGTYTPHEAYGRIEMLMQDYGNTGPKEMKKPVSEVKAMNYNPNPMVKALRDLADMIQDGRMFVQSGGIIIDPPSPETGEIAIRSDLVLSRYAGFRGPK